MTLSCFDITLNTIKIDRLTRDNLPMPSHIRHIEGDVSFTDDYTHGESWSAIESISGHLSVYSLCELNLNALASVGSSLVLHKNLEINLPALTHINGYLYVHRASKLELNALTSIGGHLTLRENTRTNFPSLVNIGFSLYLHKHAKTNLSALTRIGGQLMIEDYTDPLPTHIRHLETRDRFKLIYQAEDIANQVASSGDISVIKRRVAI